MAFIHFDDGRSTCGSSSSSSSSYSISSSENCDSLLALLEDADDGDHHLPEPPPIAIGTFNATDLLALETLLSGSVGSDGRGALLEAQDSFPSAGRSARGSKVKRAKVAEEPAPRSWDPNRARKKQREEIERLRLRADKLQAKLSELQAEKWHVAATSRQKPAQADSEAPANGRMVAGGNDSSLGEEPHCDPVVVVAPTKWQCAAIRERNARARAETANAQMKLVLANQRQIAKSLRTMLRATASTQEILGALRCQERSDSYDSASDSPDDSDSSSADLLASASKSDAPVYSVVKSGALVPGSKRPRLWFGLRHCLRVKAMQLDGLVRLWLRTDLRSGRSASWHPRTTLVCATLFSNNGLTSTW